MTLLGAFFSSLLPTAECVDNQQPTTSTSQQNADPHSAGGGEADTKDKEDKEEVPKPKGAGGEKGQEAAEADSEEEAPKEGEEKEEGGEEGGDEEEEPEEEEAEDIMPKIREECAETKACSPHKKEFEHCEKKVREGKGRHHEDCVEELMMHCVDNCSAPRLFSKLA